MGLRSGLGDRGKRKSPSDGNLKSAFQPSGLPSLSTGSCPYSEPLLHFRPSKYYGDEVGVKSLSGMWHIYCEIIAVRRINYTGEVTVP